MKILLASNNAKKLSEMRALLSNENVTLCTPRQIGLSCEPDENGATFEENARIKALEMCRASRLVSVADDSGLEVDALGGAPGIYSARYAGDGATDRQRYEKLLGEMENVPDGERTARFVSVICCAFPDGREFCCRGECEGIILHAPSGNDGFGYDPVFYVPDESATFAELSPETKNKISHRGRAMREFIEKIKKYERANFSDAL